MSPERGEDRKERLLAGCAGSAVEREQSEVAAEGLVKESRASPYRGDLEGDLIQEVQKRKEARMNDPLPLQLPVNDS